MICKPCRKGKHRKCPGVLKDPSWCDCHHRPPGPADNQIRK